MALHFQCSLADQCCQICVVRPQQLTAYAPGIRLLEYIKLVIGAFNVECSKICATGCIALCRFV